MDAPLDLGHASRDELIALISRLREKNADQGREIARLRAELSTQRAAMDQLHEHIGILLAALDPPNGDAAAFRPTMPGPKPATRNPASGPAPRPRKRRARGYGRRMTPTARQVHADAQCQHCATTLRGGRSSAPAR